MTASEVFDVIVSVPLPVDLLENVPVPGLVLPVPTDPSEVLSVFETFEVIWLTELTEDFVPDVPVRLVTVPVPLLVDLLMNVPVPGLVVLPVPTDPREVLSVLETIEVIGLMELTKNSVPDVPVPSVSVPVPLLVDLLMNVPVPGLVVLPVPTDPGDVLSVFDTFEVIGLTELTKNSVPDVPVPCVVVPVPLLVDLQIGRAHV